MQCVHLQRMTHAWEKFSAEVLESSGTGCRCNLFTCFLLTLWHWSVGQASHRKHYSEKAYLRHEASPPVKSWHLCHTAELVSWYSAGAD